MIHKKILPVYSGFPDSFWGYELPTKFIGKRAMMPPTGLATVLSLLPENYESLPIIDLNAHPDKLTDKRIEEADYIMTSSMIVQKKSHEEVVEWAHQLGKKVISGGPYASTYYDETKADYILAGDAEVVLQPFLKELDNGTPRRVWKENEITGIEKKFFNKEGRFDIRYTPIPNWDLLNLDDYTSAAIQFSRGCPIQCGFCDIPPLYGIQSRTKSPEQMIKELDAIYERGFMGPVFIVDDNFIGNRNSVRKLLPVLENWQKERGFPFHFYTEASMNLAWDENSGILEGMKNAGFDFVFLGIESTDNDVLDRMNKSLNHKKMDQLKAVRKIQSHGIEVSAGFILGNDGEKERVYEDMFNFIQEAGIPVSMVGLLTAVKGTPLYDLLEQEGRLNYETNGNNTHQLGRNFESLPGDLTERDVVNNYKNLLEKLFWPKNYFDRCRVLSDNLGSSKTRYNAGIKGFIALARSVLHQLKRPGKRDYFNFLWESLIKNPKKFPNDVTHAIKFAHFQDVTRKMLEKSENQ